MRRPKNISVWEWFWGKIAEKASGCWEWQGGTTTQGYGQVALLEHKMVYAHRYAYKGLIGSIPKGKELDHICRNKRCVNPFHLEPVTHRVNVLRGASPIAYAAARPTCALGHPYTSSAPTKNGGQRRRCKICNRRWRTQ